MCFRRKLKTKLPRKSKKNQSAVSSVVPEAAPELPIFEEGENYWKKVRFVLMQLLGGQMRIIIPRKDYWRKFVQMYRIEKRKNVNTTADTAIGITKVRTLEENKGKKTRTRQTESVAQFQYRRLYWARLRKNFQQYFNG